MSNAHNAPHSKIGYLFQTRYALLRGLQEAKTNAGLSLSIEKFDDVAFDDGDKAVELIQTKHHSKPGDTSDKSVDVWKTLYIWMKKVVSDPAAAADVKFVFLTTSMAAEGSALSLLRPENDGVGRDEVKAVNLLEGAAKTSENKETKSARELYLQLDPVQKALLVRNIWVFDDAPGIAGVRQEIEDLLHYAAAGGPVELLVDYLEGWWFAKVIQSLTEEGTPTIPVISIQSKVHEISQGFKLGSLPLDEEVDAMPPVSSLPTDERMLIRQMNLIEVSEKTALAAVHDYYRAADQRSRWARENLLLDGEVERYDRGLCDAWRYKFLAVKEDAHDGDSKKAGGKNVFRWACGFSRPFRNRDELWLSSGSFQILADNLRIGWHPDYESLLKDSEDQS